MTLMVIIAGSNINPVTSGVVVFDTNCRGKGVGSELRMVLGHHCEEDKNSEYYQVDDPLKDGSAAGPNRKDTHNKR